MEDFEIEVLQRLTKIETQLESYNQLNLMIDKMDSEIMLLKEKLKRYEKKSNTLEGAVASIVIALAIAFVSKLLGL